MVPEGVHVKAVYLNPKSGLLEADLSSKLLIDCSTIDTATSLAVRERLTARYPGASFFDSPVSGGSLGAARGTLTFMLGCAESNPYFGMIRNLLGMMGTSIFPCGGPSFGLTAKLCNNYCSGLIAIATAEAMNIGIKSGMDPKVLASIFKTSTAQSTISDKWNPVPGICPDAPASNGYAGGFKVQLMKKDFGLAVDMAEMVGAKLVLGEAGLDTYSKASNHERCRDRDSRVVFRYLDGDEDWESKLSSNKTSWLR
jgi:3-hydroxyisobutyrate dehydrogenase